MLLLNQPVRDLQGQGDSQLADVGAGPWAKMRLVGPVDDINSVHSKGAHPKSSRSTVKQLREKHSVHALAYSATSGAVK